MSSCEKCWADKDGPGDYQRLLKERDASGHTCTPEQQAGPDATECPVCKRMTAHQHTGELMCGCDYDPTPWCLHCGPREACDCGPIAENN
jgi:hypothetical protein